MHLIALSDRLLELLDDVVQHHCLRAVEVLVSGQLQHGYFPICTLVMHDNNNSNTRCNNFSHFDFVHSRIYQKVVEQAAVCKTAA